MISQLPFILQSSDAFINTFSLTLQLKAIFYTNPSKANAEAFCEANEQTNQAFQEAINQTILLKESLSTEDHQTILKELCERLRIMSERLREMGDIIRQCYVEQEESFPPNKNPVLGVQLLFIQSAFMPIVQTIGKIDSL